MSTTVCQIDVSSDPDKPYFLRVDWAADLGAGFTVVLSDCISAWMGEVSEEELTREERRVGVERDAYVEDLHQALTGKGGRRGGGQGGREASGKEVYSFHLSADRCHLSYEKNLRGVQMSMGSVELLPALDHMAMTKDLIDHSVERCSQLQLENKQLLERNHTLRHNHQHLLAQLEQCVEEKVGMETDLYSRFALVLHEKKARIRGLQDSLRGLQQQSSLDREGEGEEMEREETVTDQSECGDNVPKMGESSQSFRWSQAPTVLIHRDVSPENSMEDSVFDNSGVLPCSKPRLLHLQSLESGQEMNPEVRDLPT
ncbi:DNA repair protein XRCC4-like isoform X2 [Hypomesus transpacificus]|uniref:DNA repair protein XRCC4-like isoform X2 n=1 Tax=Hypomesus transpacificus TaxID=137520 RepID=UPI001F07E9DF|nr:DNA repair protein XRCC4-like isoform X2 [Hypomesus transpacificus]